MSKKIIQKTKLMDNLLYISRFYFHSDEEFGAKIGVTRQIVNKWIRGGFTPVC